MVKIPFTDDFKKIVGHYERQYPDKAKALTFAFEDGFKAGMKIFDEKKPLFKRQG